MKKKIALILCVILFCGCLVTVLSACTPPIYGGVTVCGAMVKNYTPIAITSANYSFEIVDFPDNAHVYDKELYKSKVTIDYSAFNPTDGDCTLSLFVPCVYCDYGNYEKMTLLNDYSVSVDGAAAENTARYTYFSWSEESALNPSDEISKLYNTMRWWNDVSPETEVYCKSFYISTDSDERCDLHFRFDSDSTLFFNMSCYSHESLKGSNLVEFGVRGGNVLKVYSVGDSLGDIKSDFYFDGNDKLPSYDYSIELIEESSLTFGDFVCGLYDEKGSGISRTDWYNAVVNKMLALHYPTYTYSVERMFDVSGELLKWYQTDVNFQAKQAKSISVAAPVFPEKRRVEGSNAYEYSLDLSNLNKFASFSDVNVLVNTQYYSYQSESFVEIDGGFKAGVIDPTAELKITLSESKLNESSRGTSSFGRNFAVAFAILFSIVFVLPAAVVGIVFGVRGSKKRKNKKAR